MSVTLKDGKSWVDPQGDKRLSPYGIIAETECDCPHKIAKFVFEVYGDYDTFAEGYLHVLRIPYMVTGEDFDTFFSPDILGIEGNTVYTCSEDCLLQMKDENDNLIWGEDWKKIV